MKEGGVLLRIRGLDPRLRSQLESTVAMKTPILKASVEHLSTVEVTDSSNK